MPPILVPPVSVLPVLVPPVTPLPAPLPGGDPAMVAPHQQTRAPTAADVAVGVRIRALRRAAGRTQKQLASHVGVTNAQLHRYEAGISRVAASRLVAIARALEVRVEDLLNEGERTLATPYAEEFASLARAFAAIADPRHRAALVSLANTMAGATAAARSGTQAAGPTDVPVGDLPAALAGGN